jgi:signal transduction histidine kinase
MSTAESTCAPEFENASAWLSSLSVAMVDAAALIHAKVPGHQCHALRRMRDYVEALLKKSMSVQPQTGTSGLSTLQMELAHANRIAIMQQLTLSIVHELTHPIATARNNARVAQRFSEREPTDPNKLKEASGRIVNDIDRAVNIIHTVRGLFDEGPAEMDRFDVNEAIRDVLVLARGEAGKNGVSVGTQFAEGSACIRGDRAQIQQVMLNLIINATRAMSAVDASRELHVSTMNMPSEAIRVTVRDTGPGLSTDELERVFEPFYNAKLGATRRGLPICRWIIEAHGGRLWAAPNDPRGAVFQFTLPQLQTFAGELCPSLGAVPPVPRQGTAN